MIISGIYQVILRPERLVYTWSVNGGADELVEVSIVAEGAGSRVTVLHHRVPDAAMRAGHLRGWRNSLSKLAVFVAQAS